jgi:hypothetical protein
VSGNAKKTSSTMATLAASILNDEQASKTAKRLAGSALSQVEAGRQTGSQLEDLAAKVLDSPKFSDTTKKLAGSVLSQSNKRR